MNESEKKEIVGGSNNGKYGKGNNNNEVGMQWEEDAADLSSSSGQEHDDDSQQPKSHVTNGLHMSGAVESDEEEIRRVPEIGGESAGTSASCPVTGSTTAGPEPVNGAGGREGRRKRGRSPADKESKRLKRLLRNRVSAQQARERKKAYLNDLEAKVKDLEEKNAEFKERLSTLQNENQMLRQILKNTTASRRGSNSGANAE